MAYRLVIAPHQRQEDQILLTDSQRHYLQRVVRLKAGDEFVVMDGTGQAWQAQWTDHTAQLLTPLTEHNELPVAIALAMALPKGNGFEEILRPCTELGVTAFQPLLTERTLLQPSPHKQTRWQRIIIEAAEQSERQWVPALANPLLWAEFLAPLASPLGQSGNIAKVICVTRQACPMLGAYLTQIPVPEQLIVAIGPEGGWTTTEIDQAIAAGFQPVSLGKRILRAVTAPTVALAQIVAHLETPAPD